MIMYMQYMYAFHFPVCFLICQGLILILTNLIFHTVVPGTCVACNVQMFSRTIEDSQLVQLEIKKKTAAVNKVIS